MQISRLFEIVYILLNHEQVTAKELAERFEVSTRTIYRDIDALCEAGVPVYTFKGKGGGIRLMEQYVLGRSLLSENEQVGILSALQGLEAVGAADADKLLSKLSTLFRKDLGNWIQVDFSDWSGTQTDTFHALQSAIIDHKEIRFQYYASNGAHSERSARPLQLWFKHRSWYLRAFCLERGSERLFRLSRLRELRVTDQSFEPAPLAAAEPDADAVPPLDLHLSLRIHPSQSYRVFDEFGPDQVRRDEHGYLLVDASYPQGEWVMGFLLSFSHHLEVLAPGEVREELARRAVAIGQLYAQASG